MTMAAIREKLYDYIRVADEKKVRAIYTMLEDEVNEEVEWWKDHGFIKELDSRYEAWEKGQEEGFTIEEMDASVEQLRKKRQAK